jgi:putative glycerol-1-phosphate prenyltransferase
MTEIFEKINNCKNGLAILIDPDKFCNQDAKKLFEKLTLANPDFIFVGGSTVSKSDFDFCISQLQNNLDFPIVIFPGAAHQINESADAILFLSLISGRNPDFLIGHHIAAAEELNEMNIEVISTSYILVDGGKKTTVEFISQTSPLPADQDSLAKKIALAGKLQGKKLTYLDAGSGAINAVSESMIKSVKMINSPLIVGGGIRSIEQIQKSHRAGANIVVIGNAIEENIDFLLDIANYQKYRTAKFREL